MMQAEVFPVFKLYNQANTAYVIPIYQRPFSWSDKKATDLLDAILEDYKSNETITVLGTILICQAHGGKSFLNPHPFGSNTPSSNAPQTIYEIVDGQQRMTTFALIGHSLSQHLKKLNENGFDYQPTHEFECLFRTSRHTKGKDVPMLIRDGDNFDVSYKSELGQFLNYFIHGGECPLKKGNRLFDMKSAIDKWVSNNLDKSNFNGFCEYFLVQCHYIHVVADDQNSAFAMFEPLNSTSEPLTAFEVYRSKVTRSITPLPTFENVELLLNYSNSQRDEVIDKSNSLVFAIAQTFDGSRPKKNFNRLKTYLDSKIDQKFVDYIEGAADFYSRIWYELPNAIKPSYGDLAEIMDSIRYLKSCAHDAPIPVLIRYYLERPEWLPQVIKIVTAFFTLWRVAFETGSLPNVYRNLLNEKHSDNINLNSGNLKTPSELAAYFRQALQDKLGQPEPGGQYLDMWLRYQTNFSYESHKHICRFVILQHIKETHKKNIAPNDPWTKLDDIEHISSQNGFISADITNLVGNLTILPPTVNRSIQDSPWNDKKEIFELLANPIPKNSPTYSDGRPMPKQVGEYIADKTNGALSYLSEVTSNENWHRSQILSRNEDILRVVWSALWNNWLNPL